VAATARRRHAFEGWMPLDFSADSVVARPYDGTTFAAQVSAQLAEAGE
jgi:hypothetical protein